MFAFLRKVTSVSNRRFHSQSALCYASCISFRFFGSLNILFRLSWILLFDDRTLSNSIGLHPPIAHHDFLIPFSTLENLARCQQKDLQSSLAAGYLNCLVSRRRRQNPATVHLPQVPKCLPPVALRLPVIDSLFEA